MSNGVNMRREGVGGDGGMRRRRSGAGGKETL